MLASQYEDIIVEGRDIGSVVFPNADFKFYLYSNFEIERVSASRMINANPEKRGAINELLITNIASIF